MFESLTDKLTGVFRRLAGRGKLTESNIQEGLREVRVALLEADVNLIVVKDFIRKVTEKAIGDEVIKAVMPSQQIVKVVYDEIVALMGPADPTIPKNPGRPTVVMMAGLQGSGKTTTCAKLARLFMKKGAKPMLVAADLQRPAAIEQLKTLGASLGIPVHAEAPGTVRPPGVCRRGIEEATRLGCDLVILDTAGRLHIDEALMAEVKEIADTTRPDQVVLVVDAMTGQDAVNSAKEFNDRLPLTGVILTKLDGDARGGAALSLRAITGKPIKFIGVGEKIDDLQEFYPDRMAQRILGMGDVVSLVEKAQETVDRDTAQRFATKMFKNEIDLQDFLEQIGQMEKMGPLQSIMGMIPGLGSAMQGKGAEMEGEFKRMKAIIQSMTVDERKHPEIIDGGRRKRIARGSGRTLPEVNNLLKQFKDLRKMMRGFNPGAMAKMMRQMGKGGRPGMPGVAGS
ncbi:MAG: signal recognition particle protein [Candidatus Brocadiae bacterium]|nr:signal recognition particle protein [Candidatus Brocadiia bacterium]